MGLRKNSGMINVLVCVFTWNLLRNKKDFMLYMISISCGLENNQNRNSVKPETMTFLISRSKNFQNTLYTRKL